MIGPKNTRKPESAVSVRVSHSCLSSLVPSPPTSANKMAAGRVIEAVGGGVGQGGYGLRCMKPEPTRYIRPIGLCNPSVWVIAFLTFPLGPAHCIPARSGLCSLTTPWCSAPSMSLFLRLRDPNIAEGCSLLTAETWSGRVLGCNSCSPHSMAV